ncbi:MAG: aldo/keto reductase [Desulfobacterales bacterium]|nr:aldo/keto reductase [Desulfobacterales bacterium]
MDFKQLGNTGTLVSELCLGTMTFGGKGFWEAIGKMPQKEATELIKQAVDSGINFIDTANIYSEGLSELLLGKAIKDLGLDRQQLVIATKVRGRMGPGANQIGLSQLHVIDSVNDSLKRLQLDHIDLLYIHGVDPITPLEETMRALEDVVRAGKVRYLGISNHPAWKVMKANAIAEKMGWTQFVALQNFYSIACRDVERELIPLAESEGLALMPWSPLAGGFLSGKYSRSKQKAGNSRRDEFDFPPLNKEKAYDIIDAMTDVGKEHDVSVAQIALAWLMKKNSVTSIIMGAKNKNQLNENIASSGVSLSDEEMEKLDSVSELVPEYPGWMVTRQSEDRLPE